MTASVGKTERSPGSRRAVKLARHHRTTRTTFTRRSDTRSPLRDFSLFARVFIYTTIDHHHVPQSGMSYAREIADSYHFSPDFPRISDETRKFLNLPVGSLTYFISLSRIAGQGPIRSTTPTDAGRSMGAKRGNHTTRRVACLRFGSEETTSTRCSTRSR